MKTAKKATADLREPELSAPTYRLFKSPIFLKNFFLLMGILTLLFLTFALIIFSQSRRTLQREFTAASGYRLEETAQAVDKHLNDMRYIAAVLDTNSMVQALFSNQNPESIHDGYYGRVQDILKAYTNGFPSIDSIYLYSQYSDTVLTATERTSTAYFSDTGWLDVMDGEEGFRFFFRAKNNAYPYLLCVMKQLNVNGFRAAIVINLSLEKLSYLAEINVDPYQSICLISDEGQIIFRNRQRELTEPLSAIPELISYRPEARSRTELADRGTDPYICSQIHSGEYPWSYVMITHLQEYSSRLSGFTALFVTLAFSLFGGLLLLAVLFALHSARPVRNLLELIRNPGKTISAQVYGDREIGWLADKITGYIQKNQALSDELSVRLNLLNQTKLLALQSQINPHFLFNTLNMIHIQESEALGYGHPIPKLTLELSRLMRYAIESTDLVTLKTELDFTKKYIHILKERYGNKLQVVYRIREETLSAMVPKLFIQPIIENAVFHGLAENIRDDSTLTLSCDRDEECCVVTVSDNGTGMSPEILEGLRSALCGDSAPVKKSIGLKNVVVRMKLLYGDRFSIRIDSRMGEGSSFILRFPLSKPGTVGNPAAEDG